jgi:hypothetical protein
LLSLICLLSLISAPAAPHLNACCCDLRAGELRSGFFVWGLFALLLK